AVGGAELAGKLLHRRRRLAFRIFLVHPVEHRQADRLRIDQLGAVAARRDGIDEPARELDALPVAAIATVEDENVSDHAARCHGLHRNESVLSYRGEALGGIYARLSHAGRPFYGTAGLALCAEICRDRRGPTRSLCR